MSQAWWRFEHTKPKIGAAFTNNADPDDGNRWKCSACRLPIFSTPYTTVDDDSNAAAGDNDNDNNLSPAIAIYMHDQCSDNQIPSKLEAHPLHPGGDLILHQDDLSSDKYSCSRCHSQCGTKFYKCPGSGSYNYCAFTLDLSCALPITIFHQSHPHGLTVTRGSSCSFTCTACGTQHQPSRGLKNTDEWGVSYVCSLCDFWIHPDCAVLPNAIVGEKYHPHPLLLTYEYLGASAGLYEENTAPYNYVCEICDGGVSEGLGWYTCFHCRYSAHINCVMYSDHRDSFKPVLLREAQIPGLLHLPMADEHQSLMPSIMKTITNATATATDDASTSTSVNKVHEHPLIFRNADIGAAAVGVCNACVQLISVSDTFYSCRNQVSCPDFIIHGCCVDLPDTITSPNWQNNNHTLHLLSKVDKYPFNMFSFQDPVIQPVVALSNGFAYVCKECPRGGEYLNVASALMPASITHDAHARSHILRKTYRLDGVCSCCQIEFLDDDCAHRIVYECNNCQNFIIHASCALLPNTVTHKFDQHPLKLITTSPGLDPQEEEEEVPLCEICEENLDTSSRWFYGCKECDQSFHISCIPNFDRLSRIKFGFTIQVACHNCPLACVRALSVDGYKCGHCGNVIRGIDDDEDDND